MGLLQQINENKGLHSSARLKIIACLTVIVGVSMREDIISCNTSLVKNVNPYVFSPLQMLCDLSLQFTWDYMQRCHKRHPFLKDNPKHTFSHFIFASVKDSSH